MENAHQEDQLVINRLCEDFFDLFTNADGKQPQVDRIKEQFIKAGILINNSGNSPEVYDLDSFIEPRRKILSDGTLTGFKEWEVSHQTEIRGKLATRISHYQKSGFRHGEPFNGKGIKTFQLVRKSNRWYFVSVAWEDQ